MRLPALILLCLSACGPTDAVQGDAAPTVRTGTAVPTAGSVVATRQVPSRPEGDTGERGRFVAMSGALTLTVETDSGPLEVRLAEVDTPVPEQTRAWLADQLAGREVELVYSGLRRDRYGRALAQIVIEAGADSAGGADRAGAPATAGWLQYRLVEAGLGRVMSHADNQAQVAWLLPVEDRARRAGRGLWAGPDHQVRDTHPDELAQDVGTAQLVEGRVLDAVQLNSGRIYLNFGSDYRSDFTVRIDAADSQAFTDAGLTPDGLVGQRVRVRGWVTDENGPMIVIDHPARLERLGENLTAAQAR
ncbi:thermonuclease family protein [Maricaulis sp.]|uniref:thermonuclease family protein n=1 Tax=Maricaulis sp. TaxID=1486257 RepID=UPI002B267FE0|nr:thermonuclease family protein [Maricaulis sp.]